MCIDWRECKEELTKDSRYSEICYKAEEILRSKGLHKDSPGYEMFIKGIAVNFILGIVDEDLYEMIEKLMIIPSINPVIKDINPVEQWMVEALRTIGIKLDPIEFIVKINTQSK